MSPIMSPIRCLRPTPPISPDYHRSPHYHRRMTSSPMSQSQNNDIGELKIKSSVTAYKVILLGRAGVGKTSLVTRFIYRSFDKRYGATIGVDFVSKAFPSKDGVVKLQLWDTAGQERFNVLIPAYVRDSCAAILVYDVSDRQSFVDIRKWVKEVREYAKSTTQTVLALVGNKVDLADRCVSFQDGVRLSEELNINFFMEASAKTNCNVDPIFTNIAESIRQCMPADAKGVSIIKPRRRKTNMCAC